MSKSTRSVLAELSTNARILLMDLIAIPSTSGSEQQAQDLLIQAFHQVDGFAYVRSEPVSNGVENDVDYGKPYGTSTVNHTYNVVGRWIGESGSEGRSLILQSHIDVVPAGAWSQAFQPRFDGRRVWGRGACDAKGQLVTLWLVAKALSELHVALEGDLIIKSVVEEEIGGNGTLDLLQKGYVGDAAIVLEPTECRIHSSHRGCVTFQYELTGEPVHMGQGEFGISAVDQLIELIHLLETYKQDLLKLARRHPLYASIPSPVQLNVGIVHAGSWPGTLAESAIVVGDLGFPPNITIDQVKESLQTRINSAATPLLKDRFRLSFVGLHNDAYELSPDHALIQAMISAPGITGEKEPIVGFHVSCDGRLYAKRAGIPTAIFGPGSLSVAHSDKEHIVWDEVLRAAEALIHVVLRWCGKPGANSHTD